MPIEVGSHEDPTSCILMCQALPHWPEKVEQLSAYAPIPSSDGGVYIPLAADLHWSTDFLMRAAKPDNTVQIYPDGGRKHIFSHEYLGETITEDRSEGVTCQPLIVMGQREIVLPATHPQLPFTGGARDCYVHWLAMPGTNFTRGITLDDAQLIASPGDTKVFRAQKRRGGALYSRSTIFNEHGEPAGYATLVILIEFAWFLGPPDNVKIDLYAHSYTHKEELAHIEVPSFLEKYRPSLLDAWYQAKKGFDQNCQAFSQKLQHQRNLWLVEAPAYGKRLSGRNWLDVFDETTEVWQLVEACSTLVPDEFSHRRTPNKRGRDMITAYSSQRPARADLLQRLWKDASVVLKARQT